MAYEGEKTIAVVLTSAAVLVQLSAILELLLLRFVQLGAEPIWWCVEGRPWPIDARLFYDHSGDFRAVLGRRIITFLDKLCLQCIGDFDCALNYLCAEAVKV